LGDQLWSTTRAIEHELAGRVNRAVESITSVVGRKSYLGKLAVKIGSSASKAAESKQKAKGTVAGDWVVPKWPGNTPEPENYNDIGKESARTMVWDMLHTAERNMEPPSQGWCSWGTSSVLRSRMLEAEWCPYEAERAQDIMSPWAVHFAS